jgi:hypothetical protein
MIAGKNESNPPDDMKLKKLRKKVQRILADLKALKRQAKAKVASDIESPPATLNSERVAKTQELNHDDSRPD